MDQGGSPKFSWKTEHYKDQKKSVDWYWILGALALIVMVLSIIRHNYLLAVIMFLGAILMVVLAKKETSDIEVTITDTGIFINTHFHPYKKITSFWVYKALTGEERIIFELQRPIIPYITVPVAVTVEPKDVRSYLKQYIKEKEQKEPSIDSIMRHIKF